MDNHYQRSYEVIYNSYMWSNNKFVDSLVNLLIFLVSINFLHYGQFILPIICLILFIDNKFKFCVNNIKTFVILCLFSITFFIFSYNMGFYCVMGFCFPMAYYIGSNFKCVNENSIKKIIYICALGMVSHILLNMAYSNFILGEDFLTTQGHYDVWMGSKIADTATAVNYVLIIGCLVYLIFYEKNKLFKIIGILLFFVVMIYDLFLGRRTPIFIFAITFALTMLIDFLFFHNSKRNKTIILAIILTLVALVGIAIYVYYNVLDDWGRVLVYYSTLFSKFRREGLGSGRLELLLDAIKLMPKYLWGGQQISSVLEERPHDLLINTYDYCGIIPFILLTIYCFTMIKVLIKAIKDKNTSSESKILIISLSLSIFMQMCLEPIVTGSSIFLIITILLVSILEKLNEGNN